MSQTPVTQDLGVFPDNSEVPRRSDVETKETQGERGTQGTPKSDDKTAKDDSPRQNLDSRNLSSTEKDSAVAGLLIREIDIKGSERKEETVVISLDESEPAGTDNAGGGKVSLFQEGGVEGILVLVAAFLGMFFGMGLMFTWGVFMRFFFYNQVLPGTSLFQLAFVGSMNMAFQNVLGPFMGYVQNRLGHQLCVFIGGLLVTLSFLLASFSSTLWQLLITQGIMYGTATAFMYFSYVAVPIQYFSRNRALAIGIVVSGSGLGGMSLGPLSQRMIDDLGHRWALRVIAVMSGTVVMASSYFLKGKVGRGAKGGKLFEWEFFKDPNFLRLFLSGFFMMWGFFIPFGYIPSYAVNIGLSSSDGALILGLTNGASAAGRVAIGYYADRVGNVNALTLCQVVSALLYFGLWPFAKSYVPLLLFGLGFGFFSGGFISLFPSFIAQVWGVDKITQRMGLQFSGSLPGAIAGQPVAGLFLDHYTTKLLDGSISIDYLPAILWGASMFSMCGFLTVWVRMDLAGWKLRKKI
ncbi:MFS general substrate transporter [Gonapodya prolifera JEL478]|uniref:MFS general substrate transporter n=1 Tax=Gonapodya prolifera (strain JEL478) TaxID=1344416 RepID=A0A139A4B6_GONPJ|nr:MFS general substrate transporter [Gonapodya prolifera JEL478]|eukprot:KXS11519.1 MFS general substrate transporter [Gonapodya prolifera JEL478]